MSDAEKESKNWHFFITSSNNKLQLERRWVCYWSVPRYPLKSETLLDSLIEVHLNLIGNMYTYDTLIKSQSWSKVDNHSNTFKSTEYSWIYLLSRNENDLKETNKITFMWKWKEIIIKLQKHCVKCWWVLKNCL